MLRSKPPKPTSPRKQSCPTTDEWEVCLAASDSCSDEHSRLMEHLESCEACQQTLQWMAGNDRWWVDARTTLSEERNGETWAGLAQSICALSVEDRSSAAPDELRDHELEQLKRLLEPASHPELLGRIGRYELEQLVGRGGMGLVFRAYDAQLHRVVAIKTLAIHLIPVNAARDRFVREARACASLSHPHIVPVHDVLTDGPIPALVMQYVAGPTLESWLHQRGPLPWRQALRLTLQLADALAVAHDSDFVHRDIKPGNVLLEADGSRALLTDFGLVRALDEATVTRSGMLAGTPDYMSPEQARGESVDTTSDLFSLGSTLYAMLTGAPPFAASDPMAVMNRICHSKHVPLDSKATEAPRSVSQLVDRLLNKDPRRRLPSARQLSRELHLLIFARPQPWYSLSGRVANRRAIVGACIAACVVACAVICGIMLNQSGESTVRRTPPSLPLSEVELMQTDADPGRALAARSSFPIVDSFDRQLRAVESEVVDLELELTGPSTSRPSTFEASERLDAQFSELSRWLNKLENELGDLSD